MGSEVAFVYLLNSTPVVRNQHLPIKNVPSIAAMAAENRRNTSVWDWSAWSSLADPGATQPRYVAGAAW
ncbi:hypothetical protein ASAP_2514 [Asaia bogorensis]|uniref:Uncharacterized protein n=1 Tax=Asaia bogorensis TaxID=91915 RepID=A0A060QHC0_9PROT|nr:hypothetical protein ASAP_2514 [Asaia bogorensis]